MGVFKLTRQSCQDHYAENGVLRLKNLIVWGKNADTLIVITKRDIQELQSFGEKIGNSCRGSNIQKCYDLKPRQNGRHLQTIYSDEFPWNRCMNFD